MSENLSRIFEERFGIKTDPDDIEKLQKYIIDVYGRVDPQITDRVFSSGEAADFLTVNETYFFREPAHFSFFWDLLPSYENEIQICCAASANGCEAYSIAMMIEAYKKTASRAKAAPYRIDAFDINPKVIESARRGIYTERAMREDGKCFHYMAAPWLSKPQNAAAGELYQVDPSLQNNIHFFVHNLMDALLPEERKAAASYDLIFFRNAFIYFLPQYRERVLSNLISVLKDGGILIMGVSETAGARHKDIEGKNNGDVFYFQKISGGNAGSPVSL